MQLSIAVTNYSWPGAPRTIAQHLTDLARMVDDAGLDTLWVADHLLQMDPNASIDEPMLEAYTTLGYLAAATHRLRLGTMVTWASIRPPALLVKAVTTLDALSGGRAWLGLGAGYRGDEAEMLGLPFEPSSRFAIVEDVLELSARMWAGDESSFTTARHRFERPIGSPAPITRPRVLVGGMGERRTLPLVARYADACNLFDIPDGGETLRRKLDVLADACHDIGRDPRSVEVTLSSRLGPDENLDVFVDRCRNLADSGVDHVVLVTTGPWSDEDVHLVLDAVDPVGRVPTAHAQAPS